MTDTAEKHRATMAKCATFDEWATRFMRKPTQAFKDAYAEVHAETVKPRRKRRTRAEMAAAVEGSDSE